jgi:hypothetical protein
VAVHPDAPQDVPLAAACPLPAQLPWDAVHLDAVHPEWCALDASAGVVPERMVRAAHLDLHPVLVLAVSDAGISAVREPAIRRSGADRRQHAARRSHSAALQMLDVAAHYKQDAVLSAERSIDAQPERSAYSAQEPEAQAEQQVFRRLLAQEQLASP